MRSLDPGVSMTRAIMPQKGGILLLDPFEDLPVCFVGGGSSD